MNRRQAKKKRGHITGYGKDWRTWFKYIVPFYIYDFCGKEHRIASRHAYLKILYKSLHIAILVDRRRKEEK